MASPCLMLLLAYINQVGGNYQEETTNGSMGKKPSQIKIYRLVGNSMKIVFRPPTHRPPPRALHGINTCNNGKWERILRFNQLGAHSLCYVQRLEEEREEESEREEGTLMLLDMALLPEDNPPFAPFLSPEEVIPDFSAFAGSGYGLDMPDFECFYPIQKGDPDEEICALIQFSSKVPSYEEVMNLPPSLLHHPTSSSSSSSSSPPPPSTTTAATISTSSSSHENGMPVSSPSWIGPNQIASDASLHHNTIPSIKNFWVQPSTCPSSTANPSWSCVNELMPKDSIASLHNASSSLTNKCTCRVKESNEDIRIDGYKWRKYGKKILKSSPFVRSYYRCNLLKCPARKYVDCSFDSLITLTSYEGTHNDLSCFQGNSTRVHRSTRPWNS